jgi:methyl-accepting chemotaxis protein
VVVSLRSNISVVLGVVLTMIRAIADQTDFLALNAAVNKADSAGEKGRGISSVAEEVLSIGTPIKESTSNIESIIDELKISATKAAAVLDNNKNQVKPSEY